jgi:hypothetical protein
MNVSRTLLLLGLVGAFGSGCAVRVVGRAHVHAHHVYVYDEAPELVYVEPGVYVVRDSDVAVYYVDGYYWRHSGGVWYRTGYWSDPWVTVHVGHVPGHVSHRNHHAYVRYRGHAGAHSFRQTSKGHHGASPTGGSSHHSASASHDGPSHHKPSQGKIRDNPAAKAEVRVSTDAHATPSRVDRGGNDAHEKSVKHRSPSRSDRAPAAASRPSAEARVKTERHGKARPPSDSRAEAAPARSSSSAAAVPPKKKVKEKSTRKKSRR